MSTNNHIAYPLAKFIDLKPYHFVREYHFGLENSINLKQKKKKLCWFEWPRQMTKFSVADKDLNWAESVAAVSQN